MNVIKGYTRMNVIKGYTKMNVIKGYTRMNVIGYDKDLERNTRVCQR